MLSGADLRSEISIMVNFRDHPPAEPTKKRVGGGEIPDFSRLRARMAVGGFFSSLRDPCDVKS